MPNQKQPGKLVDFKGRKHLTKVEIAERNSCEVDAPSDNIAPPKFLNAKQKAEFLRLAAELEPLDILSNLDTGELARYCVALSMYERYTKLLLRTPKRKAARLRREAAEAGEPIPEDMTDEELALDVEADLVKLHDKYFNQCETAARALGLNITSRCRLIIPKAPPAQPSNKFSGYDKTAQTG